MLIPGIHTHSLPKPLLHDKIFSIRIDAVVPGVFHSVQDSPKCGEVPQPANMARGLFVGDEVVAVYIYV